ncbi:MAG: hypothetical protein AMJ84_13915 [Acidithiobacillales bacterium SM23_46]|nr:MAG: hypothetical protein AMJ84_13915 [Acidithiobacillales bacterium SM23_46]
MTTAAGNAFDALNRRFLLDYPSEAAQALEPMSPADAAALLAQQPLHAVVAIWPYLSMDVAEGVLRALPVRPARGLLTELEPAQAVALLARQSDEERAARLALLDPAVRAELETLLRYEPDSAGAIMDPRVVGFRGTMTVGEAEARLRARRLARLHELYVTDDTQRLEARVELHDLATADPKQTLAAIARPLLTAVQAISTRDEVVEKLEEHKLASLPVVDHDGRLIGVIHHEGLVSALAQEASLDIQTMVGASRDERALSGVWFSVRKRLGWLHINLLTAFLASAVVGLFEGTIAKFTALAVLMPIVAGQSGNAGAQALAVTMRGITIREIGARHWLRVAWKEMRTGFINGTAIALTTSVGVWAWSQSPGLAVVIASSMIIAMVAAGLAGAVIPIMLVRFGQDPAQSSSIVLTTVTDVVGFFSFLGIATLLSRLL